MAKTKAEQKKARKRMKAAVAYLQKYIATYDKQHGYQDYKDAMLIDDVLYGLGVALEKEYQYANGFRLFKIRLLDHLRTTV